MIAVALLDGNLPPAHYEPNRIIASDVQHLLRQVHVKPSAELSARFPAEMPARNSILLRDGQRCAIEKSDYVGFHTRPMSWKLASEKFRNLAEKKAGQKTLGLIEEIVSHLEDYSVSDLTQALSHLDGIQLKRRTA